METLRLNNGVMMPRIGFGVYQIPPGITGRCVADALKAGYRSVDTAQCYGNEKSVGQAVRESGLKREDVFITTKLWACSGYRDTLSSIEGSVKRLGLEYIDLLLLHEPTGNIHEIYRAMEDVYRDGRLRAIGVANFMEDIFTELAGRARVIPAVNQVETHVFRQQSSLRKLLDEFGTVHESWSPLACGKNGFFTNPILREIASQHGKSIAQTGLRFLYQQDIVIIPKSTHIERMKENRDIIGFSLSDDEMNRIRQLDGGKSLFGWW